MQTVESAHTTAKNFVFVEEDGNLFVTVPIHGGIVFSFAKEAATLVRSYLSWILTFSTTEKATNSFGVISANPEDTLIIAKAVLNEAPRLLACYDYLVEALLREYTPHYLFARTSMLLYKDAEYGTYCLESIS